MNVLLVEDERRVIDFLFRGLKAEGWVVTVAEDGESALSILEKESFDAILLDLMLPGMSGQEVCRQLRTTNNTTPILMLTALDSVDHRVDGLRMGADDYLTKPFDFDELIARVEALVRRGNEYQTQSSQDKHILRSGNLTFDTKTMKVTCGDKQLELSAKEREILRLLLSDSEKVFSRERIINSIWGASADPLTNIIDVYMSRLRKKLGDEVTIETIRGAGYRLSVH